MRTLPSTILQFPIVVMLEAQTFAFQRCSFASSLVRIAFNFFDIGREGLVLLVGGLTEYRYDARLRLWWSMCNNCNMACRSLSIFVHVPPVRSYVNKSEILFRLASMFSMCGETTSFRQSVPDYEWAKTKSRICRFGPLQCFLALINHKTSVMTNTATITGPQ